jgi:hypothetical protein
MLFYASIFASFSRTILKKPKRKGEEDEKIVHDHCSRLHAPGGHARRVQGSHAGARCDAGRDNDARAAARFPHAVVLIRQSLDDAGGYDACGEPDGKDVHRRERCAVKVSGERPASVMGWPGRASCFLFPFFGENKLNYQCLFPNNSCTGISSASAMVTTS